MSTGDICHIEFPTTDLAASRRFYGEIFGWRFEEIPGMAGYALFTTPSGLGGGIDGSGRAEPPSERGPILHLEVEDIDATLERIEAAGGRTVIPKTKISDEFGFYALFLDNVGNRLGVWSRSSSSPTG